MVNWFEVHCSIGKGSPIIIMSQLDTIPHLVLPIGLFCIAFC